jgi:hypothetical protein
MKFSIEWAMPSRWTFQIPPIAGFVDRWIDKASVSVDPFCGQSELATYRNDIASGGVDAVEFCERLAREGIVADAVIFDPPYSLRQISECYRRVGRQVTQQDTQNAVLYARVRKPLAKLLAHGGIALSFGWSSSGFGRLYRTEEVLLVQHGGAHNDTICVAQRKPPHPVEIRHE